MGPLRTGHAMTGGAVLWVWLWVRAAVYRYLVSASGQRVLQKAGSPAGHGHRVEQDADVLESLP